MSPTKDRTIILLEEIRSQVQLLAEGQIQLREEMHTCIGNLRTELKADIADLKVAVGLNRKAINENRKAIEGNSRRIDGLITKVDGLTTIVERHDRVLSSRSLH